MKAYAHLCYKYCKTSIISSVRYNIREFYVSKITSIEEDNQIGDKAEKGPVTLEMDKDQGTRMMFLRARMWQVEP